MSDNTTAMDTLAEAYVEMLARDFVGIGEMLSADELLIAHGDEMTQTQRAALSAFIGFWDALMDLETETYKKRAQA